MYELISSALRAGPPISSTFPKACSRAVSVSAVGSQPVDTATSAFIKCIHEDNIIGVTPAPASPAPST